MRCFVYITLFIKGYLHGYKTGMFYARIDSLQ